MKTNHSEIDTIVNDLLSQRFDEVDDLCHFVQHRLGKMDNQKSSVFWTGREHMMNDRQTLQDYVKIEIKNQ